MKDYYKVEKTMTKYENRVLRTEKHNFDSKTIP